MTKGKIKEKLNPNANIQQSKKRSTYFLKLNPELIQTDDNLPIALRTESFLEKQRLEISPDSYWDYKLNFRNLSAAGWLEIRN